MFMTRALRSGVAALLLMGSVLTGGCAQQPAPAAPRDTALVTTADKAQLLAPLAVEDAPLDRAGKDAVRLTLDTARRYQPIEGFGAALTDASVLLLSALPDSLQATLLRELFATGDGLGFSMVRVPIGASDYSLVHNTLHDVVPPPGDTLLAQFLFAGEAARVGLLRQMQRWQPALRIMGTPWSAPAFMKQPARLAGGTLRDDAVTPYARYLLRVVQAYDSAGVPLALLSVQNEPQHEPPDYPGMRLTAAQRARLIGEALGPRLSRMPRAPKILEWDHNWDAPQEPLAVLADSLARRYVHGVAWHCYAGDVRAQDTVQAAFPTVATYFTECAGGDWAPDFGDNLLWNVRTLMVGATSHWARGVMLWNLALDSAHGPHLGGCTNCRGVLTIDTLAGTVQRNEEYYALAHASRFVREGAVRIGSTVQGGHDDSLVQVAFANTDGSTVVLLANSAKAAQRVQVVRGGRAVALTLPGRSVATVQLAAGR
jgi:glucosylceramidase